MVTFVRMVLAACALWGGGMAHGIQLAYEPVGLGWSADEVERIGERQTGLLVERAHQASQLGCQAHCERLARVFTRLVTEAQEQTARSATLPWQLLVVRLPDVNAMAMPDGTLVISEAFIDRHLPTDDALAFVLAHEMAHSILEHERQMLTYARLMLPRQIVRSVQDMYVEMDFNASLLMDMEPVMQQGELEADELGLLLASAAGFNPDRQLAFAHAQCQADTGLFLLVATHPPACARLQALQGLLPLARRQRPTETN